MGTFIALSIGAIFWIQHRHVEKIKRERERKRLDKLKCELEKQYQKAGKTITLASISIPEQSPW